MTSQPWCGRAASWVGSVRLDPLVCYAWQYKGSTELARQRLSFFWHGERIASPSPATDSDSHSAAAHTEASTRSWGALTSRSPKKRTRKRYRPRETRTQAKRRAKADESGRVGRRRRCDDCRRPTTRQTIKLSSAAWRTWRQGERPRGAAGNQGGCDQTRQNARWLEERRAKTNKKKEKEKTPRFRYNCGARFFTPARPTWRSWRRH